MKSSGNISALIKLNKSVVVSLDCQLYTKCNELKWNKNIRSSYVLRLGKLHILFVIQTLIDKNINGSTINGLEIFELHKGAKRRQCNSNFMNKIGRRSNTEFSNLDLRNRTRSPIRNGKIEKPKLTTDGVGNKKQIYI